MVEPEHRWEASVLRKCIVYFSLIRSQGPDPEMMRRGGWEEEYPQLQSDLEDDKLQIKNQFSGSNVLRCHVTAIVFFSTQRSD